MASEGAWGDLARRDSVEAVEVDLRSCSDVRGAIVGLDPASVEVTEGYYTDTRVQAKLTTATPDGEDGWGGGRIRVCHSWPGHREALVTGYVTDVDETVADGLVRRTYSLDSSLYALDGDLLPWRYAFAAQASMLEGVRQLLGTCGREYDLAGARDRRVQSPTVYDIGESALSVLMDVAGDTDRVGVDGEGRVTLRPYVAPSARPATATLDVAGPMVVGDVRRSTSRYSTPGRVIVTSGAGDDERCGSYDAPPEAPSSSQSRGYMVAKVEASRSKEPTDQQLRDEARRSWEASQDPGDEWSLTVHWMGLHQGDVVELVAPGTRRKCLVKGVTSSTEGMTQRLTLKGV